MSKHTPGPWDKLPRDKFVPICRLHDAGLSIGFVDKNSERNEEGLANARLIVAAPDLLEALERFVNDIVPSDPNDKLWAEGRAAIAKARGEK